MLTKMCSRCGKIKPLTKEYWYGHNRSKDGLRADCKDCTNTYANKWNKKNRLRPEYLYKKCKQGAKRRNYIFSLTELEHYNIIKSACHYCGDKDGYNGVDRIHNDIGYIYLNCVPCCSKCNYLKHTLGIGEFIKHIRKIYNHMQRS